MFTQLVQVRLWAALLTITGSMALASIVTYSYTNSTQTKSPPGRVQTKIIKVCPPVHSKSQHTGFHFGNDDLPYRSGKSYQIQ